MSLGIQLIGRFAASSQLHPLLQADSPKPLMEALLSLSDVWRFMCRKASDQSIVVLAQVHPGIEDLIFRIATNGQVMLKFVSTPIGPGYHQFAVQLVDQLTAQFELTWLNEDKADATGYWQHRDVEKLENTFAQWLQGMAKYLAENPVEGCVSMNLPHGIRVEADDFFATPLGPRDESWIKEIVENPKDHVLDFFSWWNLERDAFYYQGAALLLGWNFVVWREPKTSKEREVMTYFVKACEKAVFLDENVDLPCQAWAECCQYLEIDIPEEALKEDVIGALGYRRGLLHYPVSAGWSICLPGDFTQELEGNSVWKGFNEDHQVKIQVFPLKRAGVVEDILPRLQHTSPGERFKAKNRELEFHAVGDLYTGENDRLLFEAEYLCRDSVLALVADVPAGQENWVKGVWESIQRQ